MNEDTIERNRNQRRRRRRLQLAATGAAIAVTVGAMALTPDDSQLPGVFTVVMAAVIVGGSLLVERDEWHRKRALEAVGVAFAVLVAWQIVEGVRVAASGSYVPSPGNALSAATSAWLIADFLLRQRGIEEKPE